MGEPSLARSSRAPPKSAGLRYTTKDPAMKRCGVLRRVAEDGGFEPPRVLSQHDFQSCALGHYANPPRRRLPEDRPLPEIALEAASATPVRCQTAPMAEGE